MKQSARGGRFTAKNMPAARCLSVKNNNAKAPHNKNKLLLKILTPEKESPAKRPESPFSKSLLGMRENANQVHDDLRIAVKEKAALGPVLLEKPMSMKRILIADDHSAIRNGVKLILSNEFSEVKFGEATSGADVLRKAKEENWDVIILDMDMPGRNGLEVLKQMKDEGLKIPVLMFSMHSETQIAVRALKAGAFGYLSKDTADTDLVTAIQQILSGRKFITPGVAEQLASHLENPLDKAPHELLSDREYQTLLLFAKGKTVSEIAEELSLSVPTISTYRTRILEKTGMKTTAELVSYVHRNGLVQ